LIWSGLSVLALRGAAPPVASETAEIKTILDHWREAEGGVSRLKKLKSAEFRMQMEAAAGGRAIDIRSRVADHAYRFDAVFPGGELTDASDGQISWVQSAALGFGLTSEKERTQEWQTADPQLPLNVEKHYPKRRLLPDEEIAGRPQRVLNLTSTLGLEQKWYFDAETGERSRTVGKTDLDSPEPVEITYSDFRVIDGYRMPYRAERRQHGQLLVIRVTSVALNPKLDPTIFSPAADALHDAHEIEGILDRFTQASGGRDAMAKIQSRVTHGVVEISGSKRMSIEMTLTQKQPKSVYIEQNVPGMGIIKQGCDGTTGWAKSDLQGFRTLKGAELAQLLNNAPLHTALSLPEKCPLRKLLGDREINGRKLRVIACATKQVSSGTYMFDAATGQLARIESTIQAGPQGQIQATIDFEDYRMVDGVTVPFLVTATNPAFKLVTKITAIEHNTKIDDAIFAPPPKD
jgi:hypothetical protein